MTMGDQCKYDGVPVGGMSVRSRRCENNAKLDGFCMTHHPDKVKLRHQKSAQLWKERHDNTQTVRLSTLRKLEARVAKLEIENEGLRTAQGLFKADSDIAQGHIAELKLQNERMREALEESAGQKFISDMTTEEMIDADFHGAYDQFILAAKAVLKTQETGE
jgi:hypothetical protein